MDVTSGIKQGCTGSSWLFVMIMNEIIEKMVKTNIDFKNDTVKIPILMFAEDGLLMAQSQGDMRKLIIKVNEVTKGPGHEN